AQGPPAVIVRLASLDSLFDQLALLGGLVGQGDVAAKLDESIKGRLGPKGLYGIDAKKPIGLYARFGTHLSDITGVLLVPVTGPKQFKAMLEGLGWEVKADANGLHTVKQNLLPTDVQYRLAHGYAYVGLLGQDSLAPDRLLEPQKIFTGKPQGVFSLTLRLDQ